MGGGQQTGRFGPQGHLGRVWGGGAAISRPGGKRSLPVLF